MSKNRPGRWFSFNEVIDDFLGVILGILICMLLILFGTGLFLTSLVGLIKFIKRISM